MNRKSFYLHSFKPMPGFRFPHLQSVAGGMLRHSTGVAFKRLRLDTPDGDFIDVDLAEVNGRSHHTYPPEAPIVLILHGLEGSARRGYACETYRQLAKRGIRAAGMNFRSCSGELNRTSHFYHAGATDDVDLVIQWLSANYPHAPIGAVGFSLGANMLLKYLGERGAASYIQAGVAVSPPFDLEMGAMVLERGNGRFYVPRFLKSLRAKVAAKQNELGAKVDVDRIQAVQTIRQFDDWFTAPLHGYANATEYYRENSSKRFLPEISQPTLLLRADDDPFFDPIDIPYALLNRNSFLHAGFTPHGGHVGFLAGRWLLAPTWWAEQQAARFLAHHLQ